VLNDNFLDKKFKILLRIGKKKFLYLLSSFDAVLGSRIRDPGPSMDKYQDPDSRINIPDLKHWFQFSDKVIHKLQFKNIRTISAPDVGIAAKRGRLMRTQ
jgi:hypothetical protein